MRGVKERLAREGRLVEIERAVSSKYEVASVCAELERRGNKKPVFFHAVDGRHKVLTNVLGGRERLAELLGLGTAASAEVAPFLAKVAEGGRGGGSEGEGEGAREGEGAGEREVKIVEDSPTREVVSKEPDLSELPILTHFHGDGGAYITAGVVVAELDGVRNASFHRMMVLDAKRLAVRLVPPRHLYKMHREAVERGEELKVGIAIGVEPLVLLAAATRVPPGKEFEYAAALKTLSLEKKGLPKKNESVELFRLSNGVAVPHAEFALEGFLGEERAREGPFLDLTGTYDCVREEPVLRLTKIYHRKDPIYHAILPAGAEHKLLMGVPYEPLIFRAVERVARVKNVFLTDGGCCYLHAVVQIKKEGKGGEGEGEGVAKNAIISALAAHPSLKLVVVVDTDINLFNPAEVEYALATRVRWSEDLVLIPGAKGSSLDPSSRNGLTTKIGIDATKETGRGEEAGGGEEAAKKYERVVTT